MARDPGSPWWRGPLGVLALAVALAAVLAVMIYFESRPPRGTYNGSPLVPTTVRVAAPSP